jgi:hypothetical protein
MNECAWVFYEGDYRTDCGFNWYVDCIYEDNPRNFIKCPACDKRIKWSENEN